MARPQKEGLDYFPHDTDASSDPKVEPLIMLYGSKGYSFYFLHLEYIYRNPEFTLDISDAETRQIFCRKMIITEEEYQQILRTALKHGCFDKEYFAETGKLTSRGVKKRASIVLEKREKMRIKYETKKQIIFDAETTPEMPQSKVKKSKEKKSKVTKNLLYDSSSWEYKFAFALRQLILQNNPTAKVPDDNGLQKWAKTFDLILMIDKRDLNELSEVFRYSQQDSFWKKNILSPDSLRKHYDKLKMLWEEWNNKM